MLSPASMLDLPRELRQDILAIAFDTAAILDIDFNICTRRFMFPPRNSHLQDRPSRYIDLEFPLAVWKALRRQCGYPKPQKPRKTIAPNIDDLVTSLISAVPELVDDIYFELQKSLVTLEQVEEASRTRVDESD
jgi:hypothetical protein